MIIQLKTLALGVAGLAIVLGASLSPASAQSRTVQYDCQNGPAMTVTYQRRNGVVSLRYVYDGPKSAMRKMGMHRGNKRHFKDGVNSITLDPNPRTILYMEGNDLQDSCRAVSGL